jgi:hypothetical protein
MKNGAFLYLRLNNWLIFDLTEWRVYLCVHAVFIEQMAFCCYTLNMLKEL